MDCPVFPEAKLRITISELENYSFILPQLVRTLLENVSDGTLAWQSAEVSILPLRLYSSSNVKGLATNVMEFLGQGTKAIFLDVGGTLVELGEPESAYADILDQYGYPATREQIGAWIR